MKLIHKQGHCADQGSNLLLGLHWMSALMHSHRSCPHVAQVARFWRSTPPLWLLGFTALTVYKLVWIAKRRNTLARPPKRLRISNPGLLRLSNLVVELMEVAWVVLPPLDGQ